MSPTSTADGRSREQCWGAARRAWWRRWCARRQIQFTRGRPYKKDDNAHIEQKNWTHVRKLMGRERYDTPQAVGAMNDLYRHELRLRMNVFQPSVKLIRKVRVGARLHRIYEAAQTPLARVQASGEDEPEALARLKAQQADVDPFELHRRIEEKLGAIYELAHRRLSPSRVRYPASARPGNVVRAGGPPHAPLKEKRSLRIGTYTGMIADRRYTPMQTDFRRPDLELKSAALSRFLRRFGRFRLGGLAFGLGGSCAVRLR
jgi:hypothetical protein